MPTVHELALIGTAQAGTVADTTLPEVDELFARAPKDERHLLLRAGSQALYRRAGVIARRVEPIDPAPPETSPACSAGVARALEPLIAGDRGPLLADALDALAARRLRLPHALLPLALTRTSARARSHLAPVLGARGSWLARVNPAWRVVEGAEANAPEELERRFDEGQRSERIEALRRLRALDPARARQRLEAGFSREGADDRERLLRCLEVGLGREDEDFLEACLGDRSVKVRAAAAGLLRRLPDSRLVRRLTDHALPWLRYALPAPGVLARVRAALGDQPVGRLEVDLPTAFAAEWARDGVVEAAPKGVGRRAWWFAQVAGAVDPRRWEAALGATPAALIAAAVPHEHGPAVLDAFTRGALAHATLDWMAPLWAVTQDSEARAELLRRMRPADAGGIALALLAEGGDLDPLVHLPAPWPADISARFLSLARSAPTRLAPALLEAAAVALSPAALSTDLTAPACPDGADWQTAHLYRRLDDFFTSLHLRRRFYEELDRDHPA